MLFTVGYTNSPNNYDNASIVAARLGSGERRTLIEGANMVRFLPPDRLVYTRAGTMYAVAFDPASLEVEGGPVVVEESVGGDRPEEHPRSGRRNEHHRAPPPPSDSGPHCRSTVDQA